MYFSENLEYCTMTDVSFCEDGVGMDERNAFLLPGMDEGMTCPTPGAPCMPRRWRPQPPAHPDGLRRTAGSRADHAMHRHTRPDTGHAAPVCTRYQTGRAGTIGQGAGRWTACATCPIGHAQTDKIIVNKNIYFLCVNP